MLGGGRGVEQAVAGENRRWERENIRSSGRRRRGRPWEKRRGGAAPRAVGRGGERRKPPLEDVAASFHWKGPLTGSVAPL